MVITVSIKWLQNWLNISQNGNSSYLQEEVGYIEQVLQ